MGKHSLLAQRWNIIWIVLVYAFLFIPIVVFCAFSFNNAPFPSAWVGLTTRWYRELFSSTEIWHALYNSLIVSSISVLFSTIMGVFVVRHLFKRISMQVTVFSAARAYQCSLGFMTMTGLVFLKSTERSKGSCSCRKNAGNCADKGTGKS